MSNHLFPKGRKLPQSFYLRDDVVQISRELLGKYLCTQANGVITGGMIVETEAYRAYGDKACHANQDNRTDRTEIMFAEGGHAYVYLCYGIHHLFNVVTNQRDTADAILVRAIQPVDGIDTMLQRRGRTQSDRNLTGGPGRLTEALAITTQNYGAKLTGNRIWIEDRDTTIADDSIIASPRVGVDYAGEDALKPWRFRIDGNRYTSPAK